MGKHKNEGYIPHGRCIPAAAFPEFAVSWLQRVSAELVPGWYPGQALTDVLAGEAACPICLFEEVHELATFLKKTRSGDWIASQGTLFCYATFVACHLAEPAIQQFVGNEQDLVGSQARIVKGLFELIIRFDLFSTLFSIEQMSAIAYLAIKDMADQLVEAARVRESGGEQLFDYARRETISEIIDTLERPNEALLGGLFGEHKVTPKYAFHFVAEFLKSKLKPN